MLIWPAKPDLRAPGLERDKTMSVTIADIEDARRVIAGGKSVV